jgi:hypothetical protein
MIEKSEIESKVPKSFLQLHEVIIQILTENDFLPKNELMAAGLD